ncbi:MAG: nucleotide exchange factor GrpE [bacterium]
MKKKEKDMEKTEKSEGELTKETIEEEFIKEDISSLQNRIKELEDSLLRLAAEFDNYRKRQVKEQEVRVAHSIAYFLRDFLPIIEDIRRASEIVPTTDEGKNICNGICLLYRKLTDFLHSKGMRKIDVGKGDEFDPALMNAVSTIETDEQKPHTIYDIVEEGYLLGDTLIRPATVIVVKRPELKQKEEE